MKELAATFRAALVSLVLFTVLTGVVYPAAMIALAAVLPHAEPNQLVGQPFDDPAYFWGRPTATGYNAMTSSGTNAGPTGFVDDKGTIGKNPALVSAVQGRIDALRAADPTALGKVPVDLVTASASGIDPDISPAAAYFQVPRIATLRGAEGTRVTAVVDAIVEERTFGVLGERRVNVVRLNRALDAAFPRR